MSITRLNLLVNKKANHSKRHTNYTNKKCYHLIIVNAWDVLLVIVSYLGGKTHPMPSYLPVAPVNTPVTPPALRCASSHR